MSRFRVLLVSGVAPAGSCGVADYTGRLARALHAAGDVDVAVLCVPEGGSGAAPADLEAPYELLPVEAWTPRHLRRMREQVRAWAPDLVHFQFPFALTIDGRRTSYLPYLLPAATAALGYPVVQTWHEPPSPVAYLVPSRVPGPLVTVDPSVDREVAAPLRWMLRRARRHAIPIGSNIATARPDSRERARLQQRYGVGTGRLLAYFGFARPGKGIEALFEAVDLDCDVLVLICDLDADDPYQRRILERSAAAGPHVHVTGHLPDGEVAALLQAADLAVFPLRDGARPRNGSILAARAQGTLVVTTTPDPARRGYDAATHTFHVPVGDVAALRTALDDPVVRAASATAATPNVPSWRDIAQRHVGLYASYLATRRAPRRNVSAPRGA